MAILIIEDNADIQKMYRKGIAPSLEIISAYSFADATEKIDQLEDLQAIIFDGSLDDNYRLDTPPLVERARQRHDCPYIAASSDSSYRKRLIEAGCTHEMRKIEVPDFLNQLLLR